MRKCEYCKKDFTVRDKLQIGRFCSSLCNRKVLRKNQLEKRKKFLLAESVGDRKKRLIERYEKYVIKNGDFCWDWKGSKSSGYGVMMFDGKSMKAHRVSFEIYRRKIPKGLFTLHTCDIRECSNPNHLFLGTNKDNMMDMAKKGRTGTQLGSNNPASVLKEEQVGKIKTFLKKGVAMALLASEYNVSNAAIWAINCGRTWKWVKSS